MSNDSDADARNTPRVEPSARPAAADDTSPTLPHPAGTYAPKAEPHAAPSATHAAEGRKVSRGWLIAAVGAGGVLLLTLAFGGGVATGLGIGAVTRGGLIAEQGPGPVGPGYGGEQRPGPGAGRDRPGDGGRQDRQDPRSPTETPSPSPTPGT